MSCAGNGYLSGNTLVRYPFEDGRPLAWNADQGLSSDAQRMFDGCFADALVSVGSCPKTMAEWPSFGSFYVSGDSLAFTISALGSSYKVFASATSDRFPILRGNASWGSYVVVLSSDGIRDFLSFCRENSIYPPRSGTSSAGIGEGTSLMLCARCVNVAPTTLSSISVYDGVHDFESGPHFVVDGDVSIVPGNNVALSMPEDGDNGISISAEAGAGLGKVECVCGDVRHASPLAGSDGNVRIFNDTCYDIEPVVETLTVDGVEKKTATLVIHGKCTACCQCEMYESIVNDRLAGIYRSVKSMRQRMSDLASEYESAVSAFNDRIRTPSISDFTLSLSGVPTGTNLGPRIAGGNVSGKMNRCAFTAIFRNSSYYESTATIISMSGSDRIAEVSASWTDASGMAKSTSGDSSAQLTGKQFTVHPGMSLVVTFVSIKNGMSGNSVTQTGYRGDITVSISCTPGDSGPVSVGVLTKEVEV